MAKLSDIFLNTLGNFLLGVGGVNPAELHLKRQQQEQETARHHLSSLIDLGKAGARGPGGNDLVIPQSVFQRAGLAGLSDVTIPRQSTTLLPLLQQTDGRLIPQTPIEAPKGTRHVIGRVASGDQKAPPGFRWTSNGDLEPIRGGPADLKRQQQETRELALREAAVEQADRTLGKVSEALTNLTGSTTGLGGAVLGMLPGTKAFDLEKTVETIKANLGFKELQEMRRQSPTGGALGQIAVKELDFLQSTIASLDIGQSLPQLKKNLEAIASSIQRWKNAVGGNRPMLGEDLPSSADQLSLESTTNPLEREAKRAALRQKLGLP